MVRFNLLVIAALTALLWGISLTTLVTTGFTWWWFYFAVGSVFALWTFASDPELLSGDDAHDVVVNYAMSLIGWLFIMFFVTARFVRYAWQAHGGERT